MKRLMLWACAGLILLASLSWMAVMALSPPADGPGEQLKFPIVWMPAYQGDGVVSDRPRIEIAENGEAIIFELPMGRIADDQGNLCVLSTSTVSGTGSWYIEGTSLKIEIDDREAILQASEGMIEGADWVSLREPVCDGAFIDFVTQAPYRD